MTSQAVVDSAARTGGDRLIIVMMGAPGAGKRTQAERLAAALSLPHVSTGELFRAMLKSDSDLGWKLHRYMDDGGLVPDGFVVSVVEDRLSQEDAVDGVILDAEGHVAADAGIEQLDALGHECTALLPSLHFMACEWHTIEQQLTTRRLA